MVYIVITVFLIILVIYFVNVYVDRKKLKVVYYKTKYGDYGDKYEVAYKWRYNKVVSYLAENRKPHIKCIYNFRHIPVVDADSDAYYVKASYWLDQNGFDYSVIESSHGHYWILVDNTYRSFKSCVEFMNIIPGNDPEYINSCSNAANIRGFHSSSKVRMVQECENLKPFTDMVMNHFNREEILWMWENDHFDVNREQELQLRKLQMYYGVF